MSPVNLIEASTHQSLTTDQTGGLLIVDDEQLNLEMLSRRLQRSGFSVQVASSGQEALRMIHEHNFDLVLLDQMMPEMSGSEVLMALRADDATRALPVIMVTAVAESDKVARALDLGANDYVTKPVDFRVTIARIRAQLSHKRSEERLLRSEERYALAARASLDGLWDWDLSTGRVYYSPRWREMLGLECQQVEATIEAWFSRIIGPDCKEVADEVQSYLKGVGDVLQCSYRIRHADGSLRWMSCHGSATRNAEGVPIRMAGSQSDVTEEKTRDVLTGIYNRLPMISQLEFAIDRYHHQRETSSNASGEGYALLFLDLNNFGTLNDSLGHVAGDHLLKAIAKRLQLAGAGLNFQDSTTPPLLVARMGGDEFAILLQGAAGRVAVELLAAEVQQSMQEPFELEGHQVHCTFSIGIALASGSHGKPEDALREADIAMYAAKAGRHGDFVVFEPSMRDEAEQKQELMRDIRVATQAGELRIVYQPKVDIDTGRTYGVEALVRWKHPKRGLLQPGIFIPMAEETGAIVDIGRWVLREACRQVQAWHTQFPRAIPLQLSVNLSPREFSQDNLVEEVSRTLLETRFPPSSLHLEVTESVLLEDIAVARATLISLKKLGVGLDIDDFGTGYSSLQYLRELPFDLLKIDRYFIDSLNPHQPSSEDMIRTILDMAKTLGLDVVAEGIETEAHVSTLQKLGCRLGQGYFYSKPVEAEKISSMLTLRFNTSADSFAAALSNPLLVSLLQEQV